MAKKRIKKMRKALAMLVTAQRENERNRVLVSLATVDYIGYNESLNEAHLRLERLLSNARCRMLDIVMKEGR